MSVLEYLDKSGNLEELQNKIALVFAAFAGTLMIFLGISDYFIGLSAFIIGLKLTLAIPFFIGYWYMKKFGKYQLVLNMMIGAGVMVIIFNYFENDGFDGPTLYTFFIFIVAIAILIKGAWKAIWLFLVTLTFSMLFYLEVYGYYSVPRIYTSLENRFWDHWITLIWCGLFVYAGVMVFIKNYQRQNFFLNQLRKENEVNLEKLSDVNQKKNQLIALLSHDLKNPIATLSSTMEMVDRGEFDDDDMKQIFSELKNQSFHLNKVLNNTLSWVMTELDDRTFELKKVDPKDLMEEIRDTMVVQAQRKNQRISLKIDGETEEIDLEENEIKIILKNLLDNALKFSQSDSTIELSLKVAPNMLRWEVQNEGPVIPENLRDELFEFKVKTSYGTNREKGTGLGLPLCKKIADKLEMKLGFEADGSSRNIFFLERNLV
ncbi:Signal transduction histidine kinase [Algoriphagus ornithinivorans]|uniref:histidine kinase n=1 Tax=Algoriphagus ornithinivorans TaxID=226506 RepID=A0A1I5I6T4_9BACT|nr:ATP-binding protein [Algoriphagus ornithinivorans]SFO55860.1 Signal transduction histidine kinase [Algoriphagus ornithinivorans]